MGKIIDWTRVRRIVLNDRLIGYKPDIRVIKEITRKLPDANVIGFDIYQRGFVSNTWFLLVESRFFIEDLDPGFISQSITSIPDFGNTLPPVVRIIK